MMSLKPKNNLIECKKIQSFIPKKRLGIFNFKNILPYLELTCDLVSCLLTEVFKKNWKLATGK